MLAASQDEVSRMSRPLDDHTLDQIFRQGRSHSVWTDQPVSETDIRAIYELVKLGATSANSSPARFVWIATDAGKARLRPHLSAVNAEKVMKAPVTVIVGHDLKFADQLPRLFPQAPTAKDWFADPEVAEITAFRNGTLQGGYLILAARALGFDTGPMSGFDNAGVDKEFFSGTTIKSNFICSIGRGDASRLPPKAPRLSFEEAGWIA
jgi:3-hydroxypropanoate dehydrogenase